MSQNPHADMTNKRDREEDGTRSNTLADALWWTAISFNGIALIPCSGFIFLGGLADGSPREQRSALILGIVILAASGLHIAALIFVRLRRPRMNLRWLLAGVHIALAVGSAVIAVVNFFTSPVVLGYLFITALAGYTAIGILVCPRYTGNHARTPKQFQLKTLFAVVTCVAVFCAAVAWVSGANSPGASLSTFPMLFTPSVWVMGLGLLLGPLLCLGMLVTSLVLAIRTRPRAITSLLFVGMAVFSCGVVAYSNSCSSRLLLAMSAASAVFLGETLIRRLPMAQMTAAAFSVVYTCGFYIFMVCANARIAEKIGCTAASSVQTLFNSAQDCPTQTPNVDGPPGSNQSSVLT
jgi:hypothetical protein